MTPGTDGLTIRAIETVSYTHLKPAGGQKTTAGGNGQPGFFNKQKEKPFALFLRKEGRADNAGVIADVYKRQGLPFRTFSP